MVYHSSNKNTSRIFFKKDSENVYKKKENLKSISEPRILYTATLSFKYQD